MGVKLLELEVTPKVDTNGTGPLACLSLFPVAELDKESND